MLTTRSTARSEQLYRRLRGSMPGGDTRSITYREPFPVAIERGLGYRVWDVDGNEYIDLNNNNTSLVHGHLPERIVAAVQEQLEHGTVFPAPNHLQAELAERLRARVPSMETLRYANSGTEAVMYAVRAARAFTGREHIVKAEMGYNGGWEQVPITLGVPPRGYGGASDRSPLEAYAASVPLAVRDLVHLVPFNDLGALRQTMERHGHQVAALLFSPYLGAGGVPGDPDFFHCARRLADEHGALLILDEVVSFRLSIGGYQETLGISPDLTTLGKIIGGGFPVGAFGGRADVMRVYDPSQPPYLPQSGTFNGNPITMAAGIVSLDMLSAGEIARINRLGRELAASLQEALEGTALSLEIGGVGSLIQLSGDQHLLRSFVGAALDEGIFVIGGGLHLSTPMDGAVVADVAARLRRALAETSRLTTA